MGYASSKSRVLILDEDASYHDVLSTLLAEKVSVDFAPSIKEGIGKLRDNGYELVITEMTLPDGDALQLITNLQKEHPNTNIAIITSKKNTNAALEAVRLGAIDIITKPFTVEDIATVMDKFFSLTSDKQGDFSMESVIVEEKRSYTLPTSVLLINPFVTSFMEIVKNFPNVDKRSAMTVRISVYEMLVNAMEHGNLDLDFDTKKS